MLTIPKRMKKHNVIFTFLLIFICWFIGFILLFKTGSSRGIGPLSWQEIYDDLHIFLLISFFMSIVFTFGYFAIKDENKNSKGAKTKK